MNVGLIDVDSHNFPNLAKNIMVNDYHFIVIHGGSVICIRCAQGKCEIPPSIRYNRRAWQIGCALLFWRRL